MGFWNSIEQLVKLNNWLQIALVFFGILTGFFGAASFIVSNKKNSLESIKELNFKEKVGDIDERTSDIKSLQNRYLTETQAELIKNALNNTQKIKILAVRNNSKESQQYSKQIEDILKSAGWEIEHFLPVTNLREVSSPVIALNENIKKLKEFDLLKNALKNAGLPFKFDEFNMDNKYHIILDVGIIPANEYQTLIDKIN